MQNGVEMCPMCDGTLGAIVILLIASGLALALAVVFLTLTAVLMKRAKA